MQYHCYVYNYYISSHIYFPNITQTCILKQLIFWNTLKLFLTGLNENKNMYSIKAWSTIIDPLRKFEIT